MITAPAEADPPVAAGPFRAQLRFLINSGSVSPDVIAELVDLPHDQLQSLLMPSGRGGADQVPVEVGRKLLSITSATVRATRYQLVPAGPVRAGLRRLLDAGWSQARLTDYLRMRRSALELLLTERTFSCTRLTELRVAAAVRAADRPALRSVA
ncbi:hypothetical protein [Microlunatus speluncae]|uniref:hypothetical protein n=1 Tax=Microlunatus speluncae TaxID=2594267 RepID=UPI0012663B53|nr:hypothetical protein [Microlunatus speluncae]